MNKEEKIRIVYGPNGVKVSRRNRRLLLIYNGDARTIRIEAKILSGNPDNTPVFHKKVRGIDYSAIQFSKETFDLMVFAYFQWKQYGQQQALDKLNNKSSES